MSRAEQQPVQTATDLYAQLEAVLEELSQAVVEGNVERVSELVPHEEALMRRIAGIDLAEGTDPSAVAALQAVAERVMRLNTKNSILLQEQLQFIHETIRVLVGDRNAVDRLA